MANKSARLRAKLKAKHRKMRARKCKLLKKKRNGGRMTATPRGKGKRADLYG